MVALAEAVGVSQPAISGYERGTKTPGPEVLDRLAGVLQFARDFFVKPIVHHVYGPVYYRSLSAATKAQRDAAEQRLEWMVELTQFLGEFLNLPLVNLPGIDVPEHPATLSNSQIEEIAGEVRWHWRLGEGAISDVCLLLENNGIIISRVDLDANKLDALSYRDPRDERPYIILSSDKASAVRSRFDAAHELGHLILHRNVRENVARKSETFKLMEDQAHRFARAFLLPAASFSRSLPYVSLETLRDIKPLWKVSIGTMIRRCRDLGIAPATYIEQLGEQYGRRRWRTKEPLDDEIMVENPRLLRRAVELLLGHKIISMEDLLKRIALPSGEIEALAGLPKGYFEGDDALVALKAPYLPPTSSRAPTPSKETKVIPFRRRHL